jgi:hypothetical protein
VVLMIRRLINKFRRLRFDFHTRRLLANIKSAHRDEL